jgi:peptidoglycan/xylan/chitin deacetylase (PgdA/CDA1 family)
VAAHAGFLDSAAVGNLLRNRSSRAVFLCYHSVAAEGPRYLTVSPDLFERQLALLRRQGLRGGTEADLAAAASGALAEPTVFLLFDDGFRNNHETVLPLLAEYGMRAFCFVLPPLVDSGAPLAWPEVAEDQGRYPETMLSVTWPMVEEMAARGFTIGSHGLAHPWMTKLSPERLRQELSDSRAQVKQRLGSCDSLAYPFGDWNAEVEAAAAECGYRFAFTLPNLSGQWRATPLSIPRVNVDYRDDERRFGAKLKPLGREAVLSPLSGPLKTGLRRLRGRAQ